MVSITEVAPPSKHVVKVLGVDVEIQPVTGRMWAALARRFPELKRRLAGMENKREDEVIGAMEQGPAICAAALGHMGDEETEAAVDRLPSEAKTALLAAVMDLSFPPDPRKAARSSDADPAAKSLSDPAQAMTPEPTTQDDFRVAG